MASSTIVAIPARDEADRIGPCLIAISEQIEPPDAVVLLANNCSDATETIARTLMPRLRFRLDVVRRELPEAQASAGHARRLAMSCAAELAGPEGVLLTTDADAVVPPDWISRSLSALRMGADVVCGQAEIDPLEATMIPAHLHADDARECRLIALLDDLSWMLDPEPHDPPPRHTEASGASLAVRSEAYHRVGGIPAVAAAEDRAFVRALWMMDARVRHDPAIRVSVSGRLVGRAQGGMADAMRRRVTQQDEFTDDQVEPATDAVRRYAMRHRVRRAWNGRGDDGLAGDLGLTRNTFAEALANRYFGATWARLEAISPVLRRRRVRFNELAAEIEAGEALLARLAQPNKLAAD